MIFNIWLCLLFVLLKTSIVICYDEEDPHTDAAFPIFKDLYQKFIGKDMNNSEIQKLYQKLKKQHGMNKNVELEKFKSDTEFYWNQPIDVRKNLTIPKMNWENYFKHVPTIDMKDIFKDMPTISYENLYPHFDTGDMDEGVSGKEGDLEPDEADWKKTATIVSDNGGQDTTIKQFLISLSVYIGVVLFGSLVVFCIMYLCPNCCRKKTRGAKMKGISSQETLVGQQKLV